MESVKFGHSKYGLPPNWQLGPSHSVSWFDVADLEHDSRGKFVMATCFKLEWDLDKINKDSIYNLLHAVTLGRQHKVGKIHIEHLAQILHGELHITCRTTDQTGTVHRDTQALPGDSDRYMNRWMLLIYGADWADRGHTVLRTQNALYDCDSMEMLQSIDYRVVASPHLDLEFGAWPQQRVVCDHEYYHVPSDHVIVHGNANREAPCFYRLARIWASFGQTFDVLDISHAKLLLASTVPDEISGARAWYNCDLGCVTTWDHTAYASCSGRYRQDQSLGLEIKNFIS